MPFFPESIFQGDPDFVQNGRVTEKGLEELRARMPYADLSGFDHDRRLDAVPDLFTVALVTQYVTWKLSPGVGAGENTSELVPVSWVHSPSTEN